MRRLKQAVTHTISLAARCFHPTCSTTVNSRKKAKSTRKNPDIYCDFRKSGENQNAAFPHFHNKYSINFNAKNYDGFIHITLTNIIPRLSRPTMFHVKHCRAFGIIFNFNGKMFHVKQKVYESFVSRGTKYNIIVKILKSRKVSATCVFAKNSI